MEYLSNDHKDTIAISMRIVISYAMKWDILLRIWWKVNGNWDNNIFRIFQWRESHCRTNTSVWRKKEIQKSRTMIITVWDLSRNDLTIWVRYWNNQNSLAKTLSGFTVCSIIKSCKSQEFFSRVHSRFGQISFYYHGWLKYCIGSWKNYYGKSVRFPVKFSKTIERRVER